MYLNYSHKKYRGNSNASFFLSLLCGGLLFLCSCGLESYRDISPPRNAVQPNPADGSTDDDFVDSLENQKFEFTSEDLAGDFISPGTDVYYRIYNNIDDLQSDAKRINNSNTENTSNGFNTVESLRYLSMSSTEGNTPLIDDNGGRIIIRLVTNSSGAIYPAGIFINGNSREIPLRNDGGSFNFNPETANNPDLSDTLPTGGDNDYDDSNVNDGNSYWYVNAYAVSRGLNATTFTPVSSEVLSLGFIAYPSK